MIRRRWSIRLIGLLTLLLVSQGLASVPSTAADIALSYSDSFTTDQAMKDAAFHSPCWPGTADNAVEAHLQYRWQGNNRVLDLIGRANQSAYLAYRLPLQASERVVRSLTGSLVVTVGTRANASSITDSVPVVYIALSEDDRQWSTPQALTPGPHTLALSSRTGTVLVLFWSQGAWIDDLKITLSPQAATIQVPGDYATIQAALNAAQDGDIIEVAAGVYSGTGNTDLDCLGKKITLRAPAGPEHTVIQCSDSRQQRGFYFHHNESRACVVQGFTIDQGTALTSTLPHNATQFAGAKNMPLGGGIYCLNSSPTLINCVIRAGRAVVGAGVACVGGRPDLVNCRIVNCRGVTTASQDSGPAGGAVALLYCHQARLLGCTLADNHLANAGSGAGLYIQSGRQTLTHCELRHNVTAGSGGGLFAQGAGLDLTLQQCLIVQNTAAQGAGLMVSGLLTDASDTNAVSVSPVTVLNCTIADNVQTQESVSTAVTQGGNGIVATGLSLLLKNSIIWHSRPSLVLSDPSDTSDIRYSLIQGGWSGVGILTSDPCFNIDDANDYHLQSQTGRYDPTADQWVTDSVQSPAIDAGDPNDSVGLEPMPNGHRINLGAYGGYREASMSRPAVIYHVDGIGGSDLNTGLSRDQAFGTIQHAIDQCRDGDRVLVWPTGVYQEALDLQGKAITLEGIDGAPTLTAPPNEYALSFYHGEQRNTVVRHLIIADSGNAVFCYGARPTLEYLTIVNNDFGIYAREGAAPLIRNCILWHNQDGDLFQCGAQYCCLSTSLEASGSDNIHADPCFADPAAGDYHLMSTLGRYDPGSQQWASDAVNSPCINAGDPCDPVQAEPRPHGRRVNLGAYGQTDQASLGLSEAGTNVTTLYDVVNPLAIIPTRAAGQRDPNTLSVTQAVTQAWSP